MWPSRIFLCIPHLGLPNSDIIGKESACKCRRRKRSSFSFWVGRIPWRRAWQPTPVFLCGEIPWTEEPGRLQSIGSQRVRHVGSFPHMHMLGTYMLTSVIFSSDIDFFITIWCPSLSFFMAFVLKFILSDMSISIPTFLLFPICMKYLFPSLHIFHSLCFLP